MKKLHKMFARTICALLVVTLVFGFATKTTISASDPRPEDIILIWARVSVPHVLCIAWYCCSESGDTRSIAERIATRALLEVNIGVENVVIAIYRDGVQVALISTNSYGDAFFNSNIYGEYSARIVRAGGFQFNPDIVPIEFYVLLYSVRGFPDFTIYPIGGYIPVIYQSSPALYLIATSELGVPIRPETPELQLPEIISPTPYDGFDKIEIRGSTANIYGDGVTVTISNVAETSLVDNVRGDDNQVTVLHVVDIQDDIIVRVEDWLIDEMLEWWEAERQWREDWLQYEIEWHEMMGLDFDEEAFLAESMASWSLSTLFFFDASYYDYFEHDVWMPRWSPWSGWSQWYDEGVFVIPAGYLLSVSETINEFWISGLRFFIMGVDAEEEDYEPSYEDD